MLQVYEEVFLLWEQEQEREKIKSWNFICLWLQTKNNEIKENDNMDEVPLIFDVALNSRVSGTKTVAITSVVHERFHCTAVLSCLGAEQNFYFLYSKGN